MKKLKVFDAAEPMQFEGLINKFVEEKLVEIIDIKYEYFQYSGHMHFYAMVLYKKGER